METLVYVLETWGIGGLSIVIMVFLARYFFKSYKELKKTLHERIDDKQDRIKDLEFQMNNVHEGCHIPVGAMNEVKADIKDLQEKDVKIDIKLTEMNNTLTQTNMMTTAMYNHFFEKGIKSGRRAEDT